MAEQYINQADGILEHYKKWGVKSNPGYVYVLRAENGLYKIGKTGNPKSRFHAIKTASPLKLEVYRVYRSSDMDTAEGMLHEYFEDRRELGEWFRLGPDELQFLNDREGDHLLTHCYL